MRQKQVYKSPVAAMLWSIALPGLGQIYNRDYIPAFLLLGMEFIINLNSNLNLAILHSFNFDFQQAHDVISYDWGLFYPSIYGFSIWQAYNYAKENNHRIEDTGALKRVYFTGFFFGFIIGMNLGLYWHNHQIIEMIHFLHFLHFPVYNGLVLGIFGGIIELPLKIFTEERKIKRRSLLEYRAYTIPEHSKSVNSIWINAFFFNNVY